MAKASIKSKVKVETKSLHISFTISLHFSLDIFPCFGYSPHSLYTLGIHLDLGFDGSFGHLCYLLCLGLSFWHRSRFVRDGY